MRHITQPAIAIVGLTIYLHRSDGARAASNVDYIDIHTQILTHDGTKSTGAGIGSAAGSVSCGDFNVLFGPVNRFRIVGIAGLVIVCRLFASAASQTAGNHNQCEKQSQ